MFSSVLFVEFWYARLKMLVKEDYGDRWMDELDKAPTALKYAPKVQEADEVLCKLLQRFSSRVEVRPLKEVYKAAGSLSLKYSLRPMDALHVASALHAETLDIAAFDKHFRSVGEITLWNNTRG